jgi:hypothetical protein
VTEGKNKAAELFSAALLSLYQCFLSFETPYIQSSILLHIRAGRILLLYQAFFKHSFSFSTNHLSLCRFAACLSRTHQKACQKSPTPPSRVSHPFSLRQPKTLSHLSGRLYAMLFMRRSHAKGSSLQLKLMSTHQLASDIPHPAFIRDSQARGLHTAADNTIRHRRMVPRDQ